MNRPVVTSTDYSSAYAGSFAVDGDMTTRWSSVWSDPQWLYVDLQALCSINQVVINWEAAYATAYQIQVSSDAANWTTVYSTTTGAGGTETINFAATNARYVKLSGTQRATQYGYSIWEFQVFGSGSCAQPTTSASPSPTPSTGGGPYSVTNQQPVSQQFYPNTLWTKPLPADVMNHLAPNSDAIVQHIFGSSDQAYYAALSMQVINPSDVTVSYGGYYYASQSDPVFKITSSFNCPTGVNATAANCPTGQYFHLPSGATYDAIADDQSLVVWDQSTDLDPTPGGRILHTYHYTSTNSLRALPTTCTCTTKACADSTSACQLGYPLDNYGAVGYPGADTKAWADGIRSGGGAPGSELLREQELMQGTVNHALGLDTSCVAQDNAGEFPAVNYGPLACSPADSLRPVAGSHFFIDSGYNCDAKDTSGNYVLPAWQRPVCHAMQTYGGYVHDTQGPASGAGSALYVLPIDNGVNFWLLNQQDPYFYTWLMNTANTGPLSAGASGWTSYGGPWVGGQPAFKMVVSSGHATKTGLYFFQMPGLITGQGPAANNDGKLHLHIANECIAIGLAGLSSYGGTSACN